MTDAEIEALVTRLRELPPPDLTFVAEHLGRFLVELMSHPSKVVREGVHVGMAEFFEMHGILSEDAWAGIVDQIENPRPPTPALIALKGTP